MRVLRSDMITTLQQNYILMAKAKGLPPWKVLIQHALRPSSLTLITVFGIQIGRLLGEAVIVETIFALPGIGRLLINAIYARDYLIVQGCVLLITIGYVTINSVVDVLYVFLDPRIRTGGPMPANKSPPGADILACAVLWLAVVAVSAATAGLVGRSGIRPNGLGQLECYSGYG